MKNNTTDRPVIQDCDLHDDSVVYRASKPRVRVLEIDVLETIGSILNFRPSSLKIAREIIRRQGGEDVTLNFTDAAFAEALWPDVPEEYRLRKLKRAKQYLIEDQNNSNFRFIWKAPRQVEQGENGEYRGLPTKYRPGDYWNVSDELQARSNQKGRELFAVSVHQRRKLEREMLSEILAERECTKIFRLRKRKEEELEKESADSSECPKPCAHCSLKIAAQSEASVARPAQERISKQSVEAQIQAAMEILFTSGQQWMNMNLTLQDFVRKIHAGFDIEELRLRDAVKRHNRNGGLKLVGGQPK